MSSGNTVLHELRVGHEKRGVKLYSNKMRALLQSDDISIGMLMGIPTPTTVDIATYAGLDFVVLDTEHCTYGLNDLVHMVSAANHRGAATVVRMPNPEPDMMALVLDLGVDGLCFSKVASRQEAERIVSFSRLPPYGTRSPEPATRSAGYGLMDRDEYDLAANSTVVVLSIDTREGLEKVDEIVNVPGVDAVTVGPSDFSWSMGVAKDSPEFVEGVQRITDAARAAGCTPIRIVYTPEQMGEWIERDSLLTTFWWAADRMHFAKFIKDGVTRAKEIAVAARR